MVFQTKVASCERCRESVSGTTNQAAGDEANLIQRIKELELELARTKLSQVEAECRNQVMFVSKMCKCINSVFTYILCVAYEILKIINVTHHLLYNYLMTFMI